MKYCAKCKVNVHRQLDNCPLCGSYLDPKDNNDKCEIYREMDQAVAYPVLHEKGKASFFKSKFELILLVLTVIAVVLNILVDPQSHWSAYVAIGFVFTVGVVVFPIVNKIPLLRQVRWDSVICTAIAIALEFAVCDGKFYWFTVEFVIPWLYVAGIITVDCLIIFYHRNNKSMFGTLAFESAFALLPQILLWIAESCNWYNSKTLINFVIFFAVLVNFAVVAVVYSRQLKEDMERNLNV